MIRSNPNTAAKTFSNEELALLDAIHRDPRCDTVRLVYADRLQEHGENDEVTFLRLDVEHERMICETGRGARAFDRRAAEVMAIPWPLKPCTQAGEMTVAHRLRL